MHGACWLMADESHCGGPARSVTTRARIRDDARRPRQRRPRLRAGAYGRHPQRQKEGSPKEAFAAPYVPPTTVSATHNPPDSDTQTHCHTSAAIHSRD
eukprot:COSAG02_NODE_4260_length_5577_cov_5.384249_2_plen_98_part_00